MRHARRVLLLPLVATASLVPAAARGAQGGCPDFIAPRVVAVGDVHGSYDGLLSVLRLAGVADERGHWTAGRAQLVQTGDLLDRGKDAPKVLDLLMRLEGEAKKAGGQVHALIGNHEVMNILGDLRYVNPAEYEAFRTPESTDRRERFLRAATEVARDQAKAAGQEFDADAYRAKLMEQVPLGFVERTAALSAEGRYGKWLRQRPVIVKVNGVVFLHGGLTPEVAALGCDEINRTVHRQITDEVDKTLKEPLATLAAGENGPLWFRGYWKQDEATLLPEVERVLQDLHARAIVVGHTPTGSGKLQSRLGGRVVGIDVGITDAYGSHRGVLEVSPDGTLTALYPEGREEIAKPAAAARLLLPRARGLGSLRLAYAAR